MKRGVHRDFAVNFYTLHIDHISRVSRDAFTTLLTVNLDGEDHALSLDFTSDILKDIIEHTDSETASQVRLWDQNPRGPMTIDLPKLITLGIRATLGDEQRAAKEAYVPLIVQEVL